MNEGTKRGLLVCGFTIFGAIFCAKLGSFWWLGAIFSGVIAGVIVSIPKFVEGSKRYARMQQIRQRRWWQGYTEDGANAVIQQVSRHRILSSLKVGIVSAQIFLLFMFSLWEFTDQPGGWPMVNWWIAAFGGVLGIFLQYTTYFGDKKDAKWNRYQTVIAAPVMFANIKKANENVVVDLVVRCNIIAWVCWIFYGLGKAIERTCNLVAFICRGSYIETSLGQMLLAGYRSVHKAEFQYYFLMVAIGSGLGHLFGSPFAVGISMGIIAKLDHEIFAVRLFKVVST